MQDSSVRFWERLVSDEFSVGKCNLVLMPWTACIFEICKAITSRPRKIFNTSHAKSPRCRRNSRSYRWQLRYDCKFSILSERQCTANMSLGTDQWIWVVKKMQDNATACLLQSHDVIVFSDFGYQKIT